MNPQQQRAEDRQRPAHRIVGRVQCLDGYYYEVDDRQTCPCCGGKVIVLPPEATTPHMTTSYSKKENQELQGEAPK